MDVRKKRRRNRKRLRSGWKFLILFGIVVLALVCAKSCSDRKTDTEDTDSDVPTTVVVTVEEEPTTTTNTNVVVIPEATTTTVTTIDYLSQAEFVAARVGVAKVTAPVSAKVFSDEDLTDVIGCVYHGESVIWNGRSELYQTTDDQQIQILEVQFMSETTHAWDWGWISADYIDISAQ